MEVNWRGEVRGGKRVKGKGQPPKYFGLELPQSRG